MTAAPLALSSTSRSKLSPFPYAQGDIQPTANRTTTGTFHGNHDAEKENRGVRSDIVADKSLSQTSNEGAFTRVKQTGPEPESDCPQTPACRIPLADLISNTEDAFNRAPGKVITPDDHVFWQHVPHSTDPDDECTTPAGRGKKRHRSSSPSSSPLNDNCKNGTFSSQTFHKLLKTPQHDIAADLWSRYVANHAKDLPEDAPKFLFSHLTSCSPQTPAPSNACRGSPGLRRSISCNVDWPTSSPKRRRIANEKQAKNVRDIFARSKSALLEPGKSKTSKISLLVEKIQETLLNAPRADVFGPSSSSPLPERRHDMEGLPASPAKEAKINCTLETPSKCTTLVQTEIALSDADLIRKLDVHGSSSEFGDDDLDNDFLEFARASATKFGSGGLDLARGDLCRTEESRVMGNAVIGSTQYNFRNAVVEETYGAGGHEQPLARGPYVQANGKDDDEFSDDDDGFPDAMGEILAQYDKKDPSAKQVDLPTERWDGRGIPLSASATFGNNDASNNAHNNIDCEAAKRLSSDEFEDIDLEALGDTVLQTAGGITSRQVGHSS